MCVCVCTIVLAHSCVLYMHYALLMYCLHIVCVMFSFIHIWYVMFSSVISVCAIFTSVMYCVRSNAIH